MAHSTRGWTGARTPSAIKRVRQTARRRAINQPRRTQATTLVSKALLVATDTAAGVAGTPEEVQEAVQRAGSALDRAAKIGAIHRNAADRRKSRLMIKVNAVEKFFAQGHPVEVNLRLRGREKANKPWAMEKLNEFLKMLPMEYKQLTQPKFTGNGPGIQIAKK